MKYFTMIRGVLPFPFNDSKSGRLEIEEKWQAELIAFIQNITVKQQQQQQQNLC